MKIAIIGCGYVADFYKHTLTNYPDLKIAGLYDINPERMSAFSKYFSLKAYDSMEQLLADDSVEIVLNLTNPKSHYEVSKACLEAGKHVYSEKPLAMDFNKALALTQLAKEKNLYVVSAPCNFLSESAQTLWKALREDFIGSVRVVYCEMDEGMMHKSEYRQWKSTSGAPWPAKDEFEVGCTFEHAGYYLTWLAMLFGPAKTVTSFSSCLIKDKKTDIPLDKNAPDFSVGCIEFASGIVARLTCGIVAPQDHSIRIVGDDGVLYLRDCWNYGSPVYIQKINPRLTRLEERLEKKLGIRITLQGTRYPLVRQPNFNPPWSMSGDSKVVGNYMDFARGVAELANAIEENRPCRLSADFALHITELTQALQHPEMFTLPHHVESSFEAFSPMPWAE